MNSFYVGKVIVSWVNQSHVGLQGTEWVWLVLVIITNASKQIVHSCWDLYEPIFSVLRQMDQYLCLFLTKMLLLLLLWQNISRLLGVSVYHWVPHKSYIYIYIKFGKIKWNILEKWGRLFIYLFIFKLRKRIRWMWIKKRNTNNN